MPRFAAAWPRYLLYGVDIWLPARAALAVIQSLGSTTELDRDLVVIEKWREDSNPLKFF